MAKTQSDFPTTIDATLQTDRASGDTITSASYDVIEDALFELETKVGVDSSIVTGSVDYQIKTLPPAGIKSRIVQIVNTLSGAVATGTTVLPNDDTIPLSGEGDEYMTLAITPTNVNNKLLIEVVWFGTSGVVNVVTAALFQDAGGNALAAGRHQNTLASDRIHVVFKHYMTAGTTSATTFKVRAGGTAAGTTTFNGQSGNREYGGVMASSITITEIAV